MPFDKEVPPGFTVRSVQGKVNGATFLVVQFFAPGDLDDPRYQGTCTLPPATFIHLPYEVSKEAFLKGTAWLEKQKSAQ